MDGAALDQRDVERFLIEDLGLAVSDVEAAGTGMWSECFGFVADGEDLVVRIGDHPDDFARDARAHAFAGPDLPVPRTLDRGEGLGRHYAISERARGVPLELVEDWGAVAGSVAALLEAMRTAVLPFGGWGEWVGDTRSASWRDFLLAVEVDRPWLRTHGWRTKLDEDPARTRIFAQWHGALDDVAVDDVPRGLLHCDLVHRNVHVRDDEITGVFDWGCSIVGDPLYELAQLEFWDPVLPHVRADLLREALQDRWRTEGLAVDRHDERMAACHLHNALAHLAYNAHLQDWHNFALVDQRTHQVLDSLG